MTYTNHFSKREEEVVKLLLQGKSNKQIALTLGISDRTVEFHLKNIYMKLQVSSRTEAILKLGKSTGSMFAGVLGKSAVEGDSENVNNRSDRISQTPETSAAITERNLPEIGKIFGKYKLLTSVGILLIVILVFVLLKPAPWKGYERECEYPDESTTGQMMFRSNASNSKVHGQFGTTGAIPWPEQAGYVIYKNINMPTLNQLYLKLRYSKNSNSSVPILIYLDNEPAPRASLYPIDQHDWNVFTWTEPILLGKVDSGVHSIKFYTNGQQYGVADLDQLILTSSPP